MEDAIIPVLKSVGLKSTVTFKQLYDHSKIKYNIYAFNLNTFTSECFNYENTPDLEVIKGIYMSSSFPILFSPYYYNSSYYLDGGVHLDCPIEECLKNNKENETVCIRRVMSNKTFKNGIIKRYIVIRFWNIFYKKISRKYKKDG